MLWLIIAIVAYFILAVVFLLDKYLLTSSIPNPRIYAFYVGILGIGVLILLPFTNFYFLTIPDIFVAFISGATFVIGILWFFKGLKEFEASRIVPAVGGLLPIFTFLLIYLLSRGQESLTLEQVLAFAMLIGGSVLITLKKTAVFPLQSVKLAAVAAFFLAVSFVSAKLVYLNYPFLLSLIWIKLGGVLLTLFFLFDHNLRSAVFAKKIGIEKRTAIIFFAGQAGGAAANLLQNWAVALAPLVYVAFVNALQGVQYAFLLPLTVLLSLKFPRIIKEELGGNVIIQKIAAIVLLSGGLVFLALT